MKENKSSTLVLLTMIHTSSNPDIPEFQMQDIETLIFMADKFEYEYSDCNWEDKCWIETCIEFYNKFVKDNEAVLKIWWKQYK